MRFYGMLSISDTLDEISKYSAGSSMSFNAGTKNICFCRENGKFYESNGGNYFECSEINSMLNRQEAVKPVPLVPEKANPTPFTPSPVVPMLNIDGQEMDLQTFASETFDTLKELSNFKVRFENIFNNGGAK